VRCKICSSQLTGIFAEQLLSQNRFPGRLFKLTACSSSTAALLRRVGRRGFRKGSLLSRDFRDVTGWDV
jgi:hypothetical protein